MINVWTRLFIKNLICRYSIPQKPHFVESFSKIKLEEGTQSGKLLRLRGKGLPSVNAYGTGDIIVNVNIWTPQQLSTEEKKILEQLRGSENFKPNQTKKDKGFFERVKEYFN